MEEKDVSILSMLSFSLQPMMGEWMVKERKVHKSPQT